MRSGGYKHNFARQILDENRKKIFSGDKEILKYHGDRYEIKPLRTRVIMGLQLTEQGIIRKFTDYEELQRMGYKITAITPKIRWMKLQRTQYIIVLANSSYYEDYGRVPKDHIIEHDVRNGIIRIVGKNAGNYEVGPWVHLTPKHLRREEKELIDLTNPFNSYYKLLRSFTGLEIEELKYINIDDLPLMISEDNKLICLPAETHDEPVIGIMGRKGSGKTLISHGIIDHAYWKWGIPTGIMNDRSRETETWCLPWPEDLRYMGKTAEILAGIRKIGEHPAPLPCVYLHINNSSLKYVSHEGEVGYKISLPFSRIMEQPEFYLKGKKEWELGKSITHFRTIQKTIMKCETIEEIYDAVDKGIDDKIDLSKIKINVVMTDIWNQGFLDIQNKIPPEWIIKEKNTGKETSHLPFTACLISGLIPVLVTSHIKDKGYFPQVFRMIAEDILNKQNNDETLIQNKFRTWLFCDELPSVDREGERNVATEILGDIVAEGRMSRIGFMWASQNPEITTKRIAANTMYAIAFRLRAEQAAEVRKDFNQTNEYAKKLTGLKKFEAIITTSEKLVAYDTYGKRQEIYDEAIKGKVLWPLSQHKPPT